MENPQILRIIVTDSLKHFERYFAEITTLGLITHIIKEL